MIHRPPLPASTRYKMLHVAKNLGGSIVRGLWDLSASVGGIGPHSWRAKRWGTIGEGSVICFPYGGHVNEGHIHLGAHTMIAPGVTLSAGWGPGHPDLPDAVVRLGDRCLIGRGSSIIGHAYIELGNDVWTGYDVRITDMNHGYEDLAFPISGQWQPAAPIIIGDGSWLGHHVVVLPGVQIGRHVTVGAGSVVTEDLPDHCVAVGVPAKVVRRYDPERGWLKTAAVPDGWQREAEQVAALAGDRLVQLPNTMSRSASSAPPSTT